MGTGTKKQFSFKDVHMLGLAQKIFLQKEGKLPKIASKGSETPWPFLHQMLLEQRLEYIDYALAMSLLRPYHYFNENIACFICTLSMAARQGYLCIKIDEEPSQLWQKRTIDENSCAVSLHDAKIIEKMIVQGSSEIPSELITIAQEPHARILTPICQWKKYFFLQRFWHDESLVIKNLQRLECIHPSLSVDESQVQKSIEHLVNNKTLTQEQSLGLTNLLQQSFSIICGGPGTGKTYLAGILVHLFWEALSENQKKSCEIILAAPTGKAAANLQVSLQKVLLQGAKPILSRTLHAWLEIQPGKEKEVQKILSADFILVDESSMIDLQMMGSLLAAVKDGARLVLLGDQNQLPPIEAGALFKDMIQYHQSSNKPICELKTCLRSETQSIVDLAQKINEGNSSGAFTILHNQEIGHSPMLAPLLDQKMIIKQASQLYPKIDPSLLTPEILLEKIRSFCLLSPIRHGPFGVETINQLVLKQMYARAKDQEWMIVPILITSNDRRLGLYNGDVGFLIQKVCKFEVEKEDYALFPEDRIKWRRIHSSLLPRYEYAYCLSVHKSQGSEFDHIMLLMPEGLFDREILYTAVTRARKKLEIYGSASIIQTAIDRNSHRLSSLCDRLKQSSARGRPADQT